MSAAEEPGIETCVGKDTCYLSKLPLPPSEIVEVIVGKDEPKTFHVHKGLLAHYSEYFARAFGNPRWTEADGVVRLDEDEPEIFQLFQNFIYTGRLKDDLRLTLHIAHLIKKETRPVRLKLCDRKAEKETIAQQREDAVPLSFEVLSKLAVFSDMRGVPVLHDTVRIFMLRKVFTEGYIPLSLLQNLSEGSPTTLGVLRFFAILLIVAGNKNDLKELQDSLSHTFLVRLALKQLDYIGRLRQDHTSASFLKCDGIVFDLFESVCLAGRRTTDIFGQSSSPTDGSVQE